MRASLPYHGKAEAEAVAAAVVVAAAAGNRDPRWGALALAAGAAWR
jgi:hypothetical protein